MNIIPPPRNDTVPQAMDVDTARKRAERQALVELAHPQRGVDAMAGHFSGSTTSIPGVVDMDAARPPRHT